MRRDPFAQATTSKPGGALQFFTDREHYLAAFGNHLDTPEGKELQALVFYGVGGTGKTTLVQKLCADLDAIHPPLPYARFNLDNIADQTQAYREVLLRLRSDLDNNFRINFPQFDLGLAIVLARDGGEPPAMMKLSPRLNTAFDAALEFAPSFVKAGIKLVGSELKNTINNSEKLEQWVRHVGGTEAVISLSKQLAQDEHTIPGELIRRFAQDLASWLPARPDKACRGVLFLDTYEALWTGREGGLSAQSRLLDEWVRLLAEYCMASGVLLVITGRDRVSWEDEDPEWRSCLEQHLLGGVSARDAQVFLARLGIGPAPGEPPDLLQQAILRCATTEARVGSALSCHLLTLALCGDIVLNTRAAGRQEPSPEMFSGIPTAQIGSTLATRFLKSLHNRNLEMWVEALSLTPRFDEKSALMLDTDRLYHNGRAGWEHLTHYSFIVAEGDGFYRMHRTMREALRARLPAQDARVLHEWFGQHWMSRGEETLAFYHRWSLAPQESLDDWVAEHENAVAAARIPTARALLARWSEIELEDGDGLLISKALWAATRLALGQALWKTPSAPRQPALLNALEHFQAALTLYTQDAYPFQWADAQMGLALCLVYLPTGDRATHLRSAMAHLQNALGTYTAEGNPESWAAAQNHLGIVYARLPDGDTSENQHRTVACFEAAAQVWTEDEHPKIWARSQHNLGVTYLELFEGDRTANLLRAVSYFEAALRVRTEKNFPSGWALTQHNLGEVYLAMSETVSADRDPSLLRAIDYFQAALRIHSREDFPEYWAEAQNGLGVAWMRREDGDRRENLRRALSFHEAALQVWDEMHYPSDWAKGQHNLAVVWAKLAHLDADDTALASAEAGFAAAVRGYAAAGLSAEAEASELARNALSLPGTEGPAE